MIWLDILLEATGGFLQPQGKYTDFAGFSHDTRQIAPGEMFVAVRGGRGNGHDYLLDALRRGATGMLVESRTYLALADRIRDALLLAEVTVVVVDDTRLALQAYARAVLERWHPVVIAVAGSVGKTSTKEAIASVLSSQFSTFRSWQNYNDLLGIPLSLGRLEPQHAYAVLELGCDHPGEIGDLCRLVRPRLGVLTNIGPVQLQYFGSVERLASELGTLLVNLPSDGHFFYNQDDPALCALVAQYVVDPSNDVMLHAFVSGSEDTAPSAQVTHVGWDGIQVTIEAKDYTAGMEPLHLHRTLKAHLLGAHHLATLLAADQVAQVLGMAPEVIETALAQITPLPGRLYPLPGVRNSQLLDDTHNAAPASVLAGLRALHALALSGQRIAVLGDMQNLGDFTDQAHRLVGLQAADLVDYLITRGERAAIIAESAHQAGLSNERIVMTSTHEDAARAVQRFLARVDDPAPQAVVLIKGSEDTRMERVTELLMARPWEASETLVRQTPGWKKTIFMHADRPTWVEIDLNAIGSNTRHIKSLVGPRVRVLVALKADAYGHGALKVARTVLHNGASMLGVATVSEAVPLREAGIDAPILVFGYIPHWQMLEAVRLGVSVTLYDSEAAQELSRAALALGKTVKVHLKVDTGMGRLGVRYEQLDEILALARTIHSLPGMTLEGVYTHFAQADAADQTHVRLQLERFKMVLRSMEENGLRPPIVHAANSAATLTFPEAHFDMVRPGVAIYGLQPSSSVRLPEGFRAALSFKTQVSQVKWVPAGEGISYGSTYITTRPTLLAVLPVGYADGFRRTPRNWGSVLIHGQEVPLLGRVCMDQCMVDVTDVPQTHMGDEVVLIGRQGEASLSAEIIGDRLGTLNYEVVSEILARVPRVD